MPLLISDEALRAAGLDESSARIEFACRLFDAGKLTLWKAAKLANLTRLQMESALRQRGIAIYRPTVDDLATDLAGLKKLGV
jgi:predicted HTH domain antitoxin